MEQFPQHMDSVHVAAQLGRLDFVSALLATIALLGVLGAFPLVLYLRHRAQQTAKAVILEHIGKMETEIEQKAVSRMEELLPDLIQEYGKFALDAVSDDMGNQIAAAQEQTGDQSAQD